MNIQLALIIFGLTLLCTFLGYLLGYRVAVEESKRHINRVLNQVTQPYEDLIKDAEGRN